MKTNHPLRPFMTALLAMIFSFLALFGGRLNAQNIVSNGGFELGLTAGPGTYFYGTTFGAWSAVGSPNNIFLFGMPSGSTPPYEGLEAMFIGDADLTGFVSQSFTTTIGQKYWMSFAVNGYVGGVATVQATVFNAGTTNLSQNFVSPGSYAWGVAGYSFVATGTTTTLKIQNVTGYSIIDDVRVFALPEISHGATLNFDGVNDYVRIANFGNQVSTNEVTVEFWQRVRSVKNQATFGLSVQNDANRFNASAPWSDGLFYWDFGNINGGGRLTYTPPASIIGTWQHFALVASVSGNYMRIYRNGVLEASKVGASQFTRVSQDLLLGDFVGFLFGGELDEFRIWNVARTASQIQANLNSRLTGTEPNLVAYYPMGEGTGPVTADASGHNNTGILVNGPTWNVTEDSVSPVAFTTTATLVTNTDVQLNGLVNTYGATTMS